MTTVKDEDIEPRGVRCSLFRAGRGSHSFPSVFRSSGNLLSSFLSFFLRSKPKIRYSICAKREEQ